MSETIPPPVSPSPPQRSGCLTALMVVFGLILLLPGLCAILFGIGSLSATPDRAVLLAFGLILSFTGATLIYTMIRGRRR